MAVALRAVRAVTVDEVIGCLSALTAEQRALPFVVAPPEYMPTEANRIRYLPASGIVNSGPCVLLYTDDAGAGEPIRSEARG